MIRRYLFLCAAVGGGISDSAIAQSLVGEQNGGHLEMTRSNGLDLLEEFTLRACINPAEMPHNAAVIGKGFLDKPDGWILGVAKGGEPYVYVGTVRVSPTTTTIPSGWYRLDATYDLSEVTLFVNGEEVGSEFNIAVTANNLPVTIGAMDVGVGKYLGLYDEIQIWERAWSPDEVRNGRPQTMDGLMAWFTFDNPKFRWEDWSQHSRDASVVGGMPMVDQRNCDPKVDKRTPTDPL